MKTNKFGQLVLDEDDLCDLVMQGRSLTETAGLIVDPSVDLDRLTTDMDNPSSPLLWAWPESSDITVPEFDRRQQAHWFMPDEYRSLDIAEHVLSLCSTQEQLQRAGEELLLYQARDLFDLLRYLKYFVDVLRKHKQIWGVGRGSSVASYVLYLLGVHKIDSLYYNLDPREFLR